MANQFTPPADVRSVPPQIDVGLRQYMLHVYNYMAGGLALTGIVAYIAAIGGLYQAIFGTPLFWIVLLAPLGLVFFLSFRIEKMSLGTAQLSFWVYTGASIARVFFITAGTFGSMSLYGYTTKRDLSHFRSFLFMGLIGIVIAGLVNVFIGSTALQLTISVIGVIVFVGLTAWDTQRIKAMYVQADSAITAGKKAIMGALALYLDFLNLFLMLMQLLGDRRR